MKREWLRIGFKGLCSVGLIVSLSSPFALAQTGPSSLNLSGGLFNPDGTELVNTSVSFHVEILDPSATCVLYSEYHLGQDLSQSRGGFSLQLGAGSSSVNNLDGTSNFNAKVFQNPGAVAPFNGCLGGTTLAAGSSRVVRISYDAGQGYLAMTPDVPITNTPYAMIADSLQGISASGFVQTDTVSLTQANVANIFSNVNYPKLEALLSGTSAQYISSAPGTAVSLNGQTLTNLANPTAAQDAATKNYADNDLGGLPLSVAGLGAGVGGGKTLVWDSATNTWTAQTAGTVTYVGSGTGLLGGNFSTYGTLAVDVGTSANQILQLTSLGLLPAVDGSLLANVNASRLISRPVSAAAPTSGQILGWNSGSGQWEAAANPAITSLSGDVVASGPGAASTTIQDNAVNATKKINNGVGGPNQLLITDATTGQTIGFGTCSTAGQVYQWTASGWQCAAVASLLGNNSVTAGTYGTATMIPQISVDATGRVTSLTNVNVGFPVLSVNGKTGVVVLNGADLGLGTASTQNYGTAAGDLVQLTAGAAYPALDGSSITNVNASSLAGYAIAALPPLGTQVLTYNSSLGEWDAEYSVAALGFINGGNTFGGAASLGTKDNFGLSLITNSTSVMTLSSAGNVGVGSTTPFYTLDVHGKSAATQFHLSPDSSDTGLYLQASAAGSNLSSNATFDSVSWTAKSTNTSVIAAGAGNFAVYTDNGLSPGSTFTPTPRMTIDNVGNVGFNGGGFVGIGSAVPGYPLDVTGIINSQTAILTSVNNAGANINGGLQQISNLGLGDAVSSWLVSGTRWYAGLDQADAHKFKIASTIGTPSFSTDTKLSINTTGEVGIGTSNPFAVLDVYGLGTADSAMIVPRDTVANRPSTPVNGMIRYASDTGKFEVFQSGTWQYLISGSSSGSTNAFTNGGNSFAAPAILGTNDANTLSLQTNGTTALTILNGGNVGIGAPAPTSRLEVDWASGDTQSTAYFGSNNGSNNMNAVTAQTWSGNGVLALAGSGIGVYATSNSGDAVFGFSDSGAGIYGQSNSSSSAIFRSNTNTNTSPTVIVQANSTQPGDLQRWQTDASVPLMVVQSSGRVGIGSSNPVGLLDVDQPTGNDNNWTYFDNNVGGSAGKPSALKKSGLMFGWNSSGGLGESQILFGTGLGSSPTLQFGSWDGTTKSTYMTLASGNLAIGTTGPAGTLDVENGSNTATICLNGSCSSSLSGSGDWASSGSNIYNKNAGNVGIGTTLPPSRLSVLWQSGDSQPAAYFGTNNLADDQSGIYASSGSGAGVSGVSATGAGVSGNSGSGPAVKGSGGNSYGIQGQSTAGSSGYFQSTLSSNTSPTLVVAQNANATPDLQQWLNGSGTVMVNITSNGSVGIGTSNPAAPLDIATSTSQDPNGVAELIKLTPAVAQKDADNNPLTSTQFIGLSSTDGQLDAMIFSSLSSSADGPRSNYRFQGTSADGSLDTVLSGGSLTVPDSITTGRLSLNGGSSIDINLLGSIMNGDITARIGSNVNYPFSASATQDWSGSSYGERVVLTSRQNSGATFHSMTLDQSGYVGIGTTVPAAQLDIFSSQTGNFLKLSRADNPTQEFLNIVGASDSYNGTKFVFQVGNYDGFPGDDSTINVMTLSSAGSGTIAVGVDNPVGQMANTESATTDASGSQTNPVYSLNWSMPDFGGSAFPNDEGYVASFFNPNKIPQSDGVLIKSAENSTNPVLAVDYGATQTGAGTPLFWVLGNGNVGVGTANPTTPLQVKGEISPSADNIYPLGDSALRFSYVYAANGLVQTSDSRMKKDVDNSDLGLSFINRLRPVSYHWKEGDKDLHYGLIAQETQAAIAAEKTAQNPADHAIVDYDPKTDRFGMRYSELISPVIKAIQDLYHRLVGLEANVAEQSRDVASLKKTSQELQSDLIKLKSELEQKNALIQNLQQQNVKTKSEMEDLKERMLRLENQSPSK